jgi:hypothetical protein
VFGDRRDDLYAQFPSLLGSGHRITSEATDTYNCVGWVRRELDRWYEPEIFWPEDVPQPVDDDDLPCYLALFESWGYVRCAGPKYEQGFLKLAIYADEQAFQHVAKQLRDGTWSSKAGHLHDLRHNELEALYPCGIMRHALPVAYMKKIDDGDDPQDVELSGLIVAERR